MSRYWMMLLALWLCAPVCAESRQFGEYEVFYTVFASSFLRPEIAGAYQLVRAPDRAVLNIAVRRRNQTQGDVPVSAELRGERGDLIRKLPIEFREVREPGAIYYLSEFDFSSGELQYFKVWIKPQGDTATLEISFDKALYED